MAEALDAGYRRVDTARLYENGAEVGNAIDSASVDRDDPFVATKVGYFDESKKTPNTSELASTRARKCLMSIPSTNGTTLASRSLDGIGTVLPMFGNYTRPTSSIRS